MFTTKDIKIMTLLFFFFSVQESFQLFDIILDESKNNVNLGELLHQLTDYNKQSVKQQQ
jgi:hypothetical protein